MDEVGGALVAIALVLCAVFIPTAFITGISGAVLPAVRGHHRGLDDHFRHRVADAVARAGGAAVAAARS